MWIRVLIGAAVGLTAGGLIEWRRRRRDATASPNGRDATGRANGGASETPGSSAGSRHTRVAAVPWMGLLFGALVGAAVAWAFFPPAIQGAASAEAIQSALADPDTPVLLDFYSDSCPPCRRLAPTIDKLAAEYAGRARVLKVNVAAHPDLAREYGVQAIPDVWVVRNGQPVAHIGPGVKDADAYRAALDKALAAANGR